MQVYVRVLILACVLRAGNDILATGNVCRNIEFIVENYKKNIIRD